MYQNDDNLIKSINEQIEYKEKLKNLLKILEQKNNELNNYSNEINSLKKEIDSIKEINLKTKDYLLLELESNLDKQNQSFFKQNSKIDSFNEVVNSLSDSNECKISEIYSLNEKIGKLKQCLEDKNNLINSLELKNNEFEELLSVKDDFISGLNEEIDSLNNIISSRNNEINDLRNLISRKEGEFNKIINLLNEQSKILEKGVEEKNISIKSLMGEKDILNDQFSKENQEYCISCYKDVISNNNMEIEYLKKNSLIKELSSPFAYIYLILKSNPKELSINFKLYKALKNSKCFDVGFYLNNNKDVLDNWCKYFSPELHYVCNGFKESRTFNKKYVNKNSKKELLDYILNCH